MIFITFETRNRMQTISKLVLIKLPLPAVMQRQLCSCALLSIFGFYLNYSAPCGSGEIQHTLYIVLLYTEHCAK